MIKDYNTGREGYVALKLYMSKACDRVECIFVERVMIKLGFAVELVERIMHCISTVSFTANINGATIGNIIPSKGLRQGDPISPYLFLLCVEWLSALIKNASLNSQVMGLLVMGQGVCVSHLFFANDSLILHFKVWNSSLSFISAFFNSFRSELYSDNWEEYVSALLVISANLISFFLLVVSR